GLDVEVLTFKGDADLVQAVMSGDVDIALGSLSGPITAKLADQDVTVFYGGFNMPAFAFYSIPEITTLEEGKGRNWGVTTHGSSTDLLTRYVLTQEGLDPNTDVNIIPSGSGRMPAMAAGQLDVNIFSYPDTFLAEREGYNKLI